MPDAGALSFLANASVSPAQPSSRCSSEAPRRARPQAGLVNAVGPPEELADAAFTLADRLVAATTVALASVKERWTPWPRTASPNSSASRPRATVTNVVTEYT